MSRRSEPAKFREWSDRLRRFERSSQTVADFCRAEGVSRPSFYRWKRRLAGGERRHPAGVKPRQRSGSPANRRVGFRSVVITPPAHAARVKVRLPDGVEIDLGDDPRVIERVVGQLLQHQAGTGADGC